MYNSKLKQDILRNYIVMISITGLGVVSGDYQKGYDNYVLMGLLLIYVGTLIVETVSKSRQDIVKMFVAPTVVGIALYSIVNVLIGNYGLYVLKTILLNVLLVASIVWILKILKVNVKYNYVIYLVIYVAVFLGVMKISNLDGKLSILMVFICSGIYVISITKMIQDILEKSENIGNEQEIISKSYICYIRTLYVENLYRNKKGEK